MTVENVFRGRNIVVLLVLVLFYLIYSSSQTPESTLSKLLTPKPTIAPTVAPASDEDIVEEHEPDEEVSQSQGVQGVAAERQVVLVTKVVDGDTIEVSINGIKEKIRIIGLNTPETVDPRRGVQCFGREASNFAKQTLTGKMVYLEADPTQTERDKYGRLLRFVFLENSIDFGKLMIQEGYGQEYTYDLPYKYQTDYKKAEQQAKANKKGLWSDNACP